MLLPHLSRYSRSHTHIENSWPETLARWLPSNLICLKGHLAVFVLPNPTTKVIYLFIYYLSHTWLKKIKISKNQSINLIKATLSRHCTSQKKHTLYFLNPENLTFKSQTFQQSQSTPQTHHISPTQLKGYLIIKINCIVNKCEALRKWWHCLGG